MLRLIKPMNIFFINFIQQFQSFNLCFQLCYLVLQNFYVYFGMLFLLSLLLFVYYSSSCCYPAFFYTSLLITVIVFVNLFRICFQIRDLTYLLLLGIVVLLPIYRLAFVKKRQHIFIIGQLHNSQIQAVLQLHLQIDLFQKHSDFKVISHHYDARKFFTGNSCTIVKIIYLYIRISYNFQFRFLQTEQSRQNNQFQLLLLNKFELQGNMEVDINQPKSKAFNVFLRMFQLGCQLIITYWALKSDGVSACDFNIPNITSYIAYGLAAINLMSLIAIRCSNGFPRYLFFAVLILDILTAIAIIIINAVNGFRGCASDKIFYHFSIIETAITLVLVFVTLAMRLVWEQRYTNSPGNLVWPALFLPPAWSQSFRIYMQIIGIVTAIISVVTFIANLSSLFNTSTSTRKFVTFAWAFGIVVFLLLQGLAIFKYVTSSHLNEYIDIYAKKTLAVFIGVKALDILFWIWGMKTLDYEKGDHIREDLFQGKTEKKLAAPPQKSVFVSNSYGTIKI